MKRKDLDSYVVILLPLSFITCLSFIFNQGAWIFMHTTHAWWHLFNCFLAFSYWSANSVNDDNEREVFCYTQVKGWYGNIFTDSQRTLLFPFWALQQDSYFKSSQVNFFLFSHAFVMENNCFTHLSKCWPHVYRISVCCTGCLFNTSTHSQPVVICSPASAWIQC